MQTVNGEQKQIKQLVLPAGTIVSLNGIPFELVNDTAVYGTSANLKLATAQQDAIGSQEWTTP